MVIDDLRVPVVLAPMAGGPSTPALAAAVCQAGGLGFIALGYLTADAAREQVTAVKALTGAPFGANVFVPGDGPAPPERYAAYADRVAAWARDRDLPVGEPAYSDDDYAAKIELLLQEPAAVVSFTFGCPSEAVVRSLRAAGSEIWVTVTSAEEARRAAAVRPDALVAQGIEAGGHRGTFSDTAAPGYGLLALLQLVRDVYPGRIVAAGGIATSAGVAAVLAAGASAAQIGSAFMLCPEAGTSVAHREALASGEPTSLTRAFSGRLARGIRNAFMHEHDPVAPVAYPEVHYLTAPLRARARERGDASSINLWAGEAYGLARPEPAADVVARLSAADRE
jgi:nitronate monooxygenase